MKTLCFAIILWGLVVGGGVRAEDSQTPKQTSEPSQGGYSNPSAPAGEYLKTLKENSWLCSTPEAYDQAIEKERNGQGKNLEELKKQLLEQKLCMYIDHEYAEKIMHPSVKVLERQGNKIKVTFAVEFRKRFELLHHQITRVVYAGWTDTVNLIDYIP